jgi:iron-regulated transporter 1
MRHHDGLNRRKAWILYLNHTLSAWNARSYGFAAVLFTAAAYPKGLRAASLIGISTSLTAICFGSAIGRWIDNGPSRLRTLLTTVAINRCSIIAACVLWYLIVGGRPKPDAVPGSGDTVSLLHGSMKTLAFGILLLLGVTESLSRNANVITIERDWVPVLAPVITPSGYNLAHVNAVMARIDMTSKLIAPIVISAALSIIPIREGVMAMALLNSISLVGEFWSALQLWAMCPELAEKRVPDHADLPVDHNHDGCSAKKESFIAAYISSLKLYFRSSAWRPSLAMTVTHASILSISSVTVVFLLHSGYSLRLVTVGEALSAIFELSSTFLVPLRVQKVSRKLATMEGYEFSAVPQDDDENDSKPESHAVAIDDQSRYVDMAIAHVGRSGVLTMAFTLVSLNHDMRSMRNVLTLVAPHRTHSALLDACASVPHSTNLREPDSLGLSDCDHHPLCLPCSVSSGTRHALPRQPAARAVEAAFSPAIILCRRGTRL